MKAIYLNKINNILDTMVEEYGNNHETTTKVLNYQYYCGQLHALYELIEETEGIQELVKYYEHRKEERNRITKLYNDDYITPLYNKTRANRI
jgi:hypothetical protein